MPRPSRRPRALTTAALIPLVLVAACSGDEDDGTGGDVAPISATLRAESPSIFWDVSPDGEWISQLVSGSELCLTPVASDEAEQCVDLGDRRSSAARWSPDSQTLVVVPDMARTLQPDPMLAVALDGTITELTTVEDEDRRDGIPFEAAYLDDDTVMYWTFDTTDELTAQFWTIDLDGSDQQLLAEFSDDTTLPYLGLLPLDEKRALLPAGESIANADLLEFDLEAGTTTVVVPGGRDRRPSGPTPIEQAGDVVLVADPNRLGDFGRTAPQGEFWALLIDDRVISVPDRGFFRARSAALSPNGRQVAVLEVYVGRDAEGNEGESPVTLRENLEAIRVSIATVDSIVAGEPEWFDLTGFAELGTAGDSDGLASGVVWTEPDRLWLELQDGLFEVAIGPPS